MYCRICSQVRCGCVRLCIVVFLRLEKIMAANNENLGKVKFDAYGVSLVIEKDGSAIDYCNMRLAQLRAISALMYGGGYESFMEYSDVTKNDALWLVYELANEVNQLMPLVYEQAANSNSKNCACVGKGKRHD